MTTSNKPKIGIVISSIRANRFADHPAQWIKEIASATVGGQCGFRRNGALP